MAKRTILAKKKVKGDDKHFPIVVIGGSAGGMEAMQEILSNLPASTGMAFVYIQHLDAIFKSSLDEILSRSTKMKVQVVKNSMKLQANEVFVIPHENDIIFEGNRLKLTERGPLAHPHHPIDKFLTSVASTDHKEATIGVLLSGNANDGTLGLKSLKLAGGLVFVQDDSAKFQSMPKAAVAEGIVDLILSPKEIAEELIRISSKKGVYKSISEDISERDLAGEDFTLIIQLLRKSTGVDFAHYKLSTIKRRILRRMLLLKIESLNEYVKYLRQHNNEVMSLFQDILINVTSFFRDEDTLEYLRKTVLPRIIKTKTIGEPIRIWIPACSTGEEAYSIAIILIELLKDKISNFPIQIFATDLSEVAITKARVGMYSKSELKEVSAARLQRYFTKVDGSYRIIKTIRDLCIFAPHNVFRDPPFSRLDLISCCNLMIYLDTVLQRKLVATFHYALINTGYLVLGKSETIGAHGQLFSQLEKKYKIYSRKNDNSIKARFDLSYYVNESQSDARPRMQLTTKPKGFDANLEHVVNDILLDKYVPASVVVNQDLEILQFRGSTGLFLEPSPGKASLNLLKMVRTGLAFELRNAVHKCMKSGSSEKKTGLDVKNNGSTFKASLEVSPIPSEGEERLFLIIFEKASNLFTMETNTSASKDKIVKQLQNELTTLKDDMRSILEEQEAGLEELQSANEEIVSSNEELQSINEELETSKEEVESTNEELLTINKELQVRNEQLAESYEYSEAVFNTIREAVLVLDADFRVRTANEAFYRIFNVKEEETEGKLIYELGNRQWDIHKLRQLLEEIIPENSNFNNFEVTHEFPGIGEKIMILNARKIVQMAQNKHLILLAIEDITEHRQGQRILEEREMWFKNMADNAPVMIWVAGLDKKRTFFNKTWVEFTGQDFEKESTDNWKKVIHEEDLPFYMNMYEVSFLQRKVFQVEYRLRRKDGEYRWMLDMAKPSFSVEGGFLGYIGSCTELHDKKLLHDELEKRVVQRTHDLEEMNNELQRSNRELQQFAYVASHDLQEPLRKIMTFADRMDTFKHELPDQAKTYLEKITSSSQRMTRLIDDLLDYSRISRSEGKFIKVDLNKTLREVLFDFEVLIKEKKMTLKIEHLPIVYGIPLQMEQLFHNLVSNAFKFSREDVDSEISITCERVKGSEIKDRTLDNDTLFYEIIFKDNGIGFASEFAEQIFIIFQRLNDRKNYPGTGIGLALCQKIVLNHGGDIFARSQENHGSEFHVILPVNARKEQVLS